MWHWRDEFSEVFEKVTLYRQILSVHMSFTILKNHDIIRFTEKQINLDVLRSGLKVEVLNDRT